MRFYSPEQVVGSVHILQYNNDTDAAELNFDRYTSAGVDLTTLHAGIITDNGGTVDRIIQFADTDTITVTPNPANDKKIIVTWKIGLNTTVQTGQVSFIITFVDDDNNLVWQDGPYIIQIDPTAPTEQIVAQYPSLLMQYEAAMRKLYADAQEAVEQATAEAGEAKAQADRAKTEADRAETASEAASTAKTAVKTMQQAVATDKSVVEAAQKDVETRQTEIGTAHEDIKTKTTAVLQAAEQVRIDRQAVNQEVTAFEGTVTSAVETIDAKETNVLKSISDAESVAGNAIKEATSEAGTAIRNVTSDAVELIAKQSQDITDTVNKAKTDITGMVSNAQAAESAAAQSAAQAAQSAQEAQAAVDSIGDVTASILTTTMTGTGGVTLDYTADHPLKSLQISGVDAEQINVWLCGKNLFDKSRAKNGYYVDANGNEVAGANWCVATIPMPPNRSIAITASYQGGAPRYCFFDPGGALLLATQNKVLTTPDGTAYAKLSISAAELNTFAIELAGKQSEYIPYTGVEIVVNPQDIDASGMRCYRGTTNIMAYTTDWQQPTVTAEAIQDLNLVIREIKQAIVAGGAI